MISVKRWDLSCWYQLIFQPLLWQLKVHAFSFLLPMAKLTKQQNIGTFQNGLLTEFFVFCFISSFPHPSGIVRSSVLRADSAKQEELLKFSSRRICFHRFLRFHSFSFTTTPHPLTHLTRVGPWSLPLQSSNMGNPFWPAFPLLSGHLFQLDSVLLTKFSVSVSF